MSFYRRQLPHWHPGDAWIFLTWRLHGSMPRKIALITDGRKLTDGQRFAMEDRELESAATGPRWMNDPRIASVVAQTIVEQETKWNMYELGAWVVMPNHVHILINPHRPVPAITRAIKNNSARLANRILNRQGQPFWQNESFDRWIRTPEARDRAADYIENNPVTAGIVTRADQWPWSHCRTMHSSTRTGR